jgi:hypothetical protein
MRCLFHFKTLGYHSKWYKSYKYIRIWTNPLILAIFCLSQVLWSELFKNNEIHGKLAWSWFIQACAWVAQLNPASGDIPGRLNWLVIAFTVIYMLPCFKFMAWNVRHHCDVFSWLDWAVLACPILGQTCLGSLPRSPCLRETISQ